MWMYMFDLEKSVELLVKVFIVEICVHQCIVN